MNLNFTTIVENAFVEPNANNQQNYFSRVWNDAKNKGYDFKTFGNGISYGYRTSVFKVNAAAAEITGWTRINKIFDEKRQLWRGTEFENNFRPMEFNEFRSLLARYINGERDGIFNDIELHPIFENIKIENEKYFAAKRNIYSILDGLKKQSEKTEKKNETKTTKVADIKFNIINMRDKIEVGNISNNSGQITVGKDNKTEVNSNDNKLAEKSFNWNKWGIIITILLGIASIIIPIFHT